MPWSISAAIAEDYEDWKRAGNPGWGCDEVLPAYKAIEDYAAGDPAYRGRGGPLHISDIGDDAHPLCRHFIAASEAAGLAFNADFNGAEQEGVGLYQLTTKGGRRMSAARAFLRPAMRREEPEGGDACAGDAHAASRAAAPSASTMCSMARAGRRRARREVILSGGAINSPQLLQLSGIGPGALLQRHGIPVVLDNANVGARMQDHHGINYTWRMKVPTLNDALRPWWGKLRAGTAVHLSRGAGRCRSRVNQGGGFFRTDPAHAAAQHAALHAGLLDADPQGRRAAAADARSLLRPVAGPLQLPADQHGRGGDSVTRSLHPSAHDLQCLCARIAMSPRCWRR